MDSSNKSSLPDKVLLALLRELKSDKPSKPKNQESSHSNSTNNVGYLDLEREDEETVLIKLPPKICEHWIKEMEKVEDDDAPIRLGTVWVANDGTNRVKLDLDVDMAPEKFPTVYDLNVAPEKRNVHIFTEKNPELGGQYGSNLKRSVSIQAKRQKDEILKQLQKPRDQVGNLEREKRSKQD